MFNSSRTHLASRRGGVGVELLLVVILILVALPLAWFWWRGSGGASVDSSMAERDVAESSEPGSEATDAWPVFRVPELQPDKSSATEFGRRFAQRLRAGETAFLNDRFDHEALVRRAYRLEQFIPEIHGPSLDDFQEHYSFSGGLLNQIDDPASIRFVRVIDRDGRRYLLFRHAGDDGLGEYVELEVIFDDRQRIRVADLTRYPQDMLSDEWRQRTLANFQFANLMGLVADEDERGWVDDSHWFLRFSHCWINLKAAELAQVYDLMPPALRSHPFMLRGTFWALHELEQADRADDLLAIIESSSLDDPGLNLLVWDHYRSTGRHQEALDMVDRLEDHFGPEAGLEVRRATSYAELQEWDAARDALRAAIQQEPDMRVAYEKLVELALAQRDYDELVEVLQEMGVETGHWILHPHLDPRMDEFVGSPQHEQWIDHLRTEGVLPPDWVSDPWEALGENVERALNSGDPEALGEYFTLDHFREKILAGFQDVDDPRLDRLRAELAETSAMLNAVGEGLVRSLGIEGSAKFLRVRSRKDTQELLVRVLLPDDSSNYLFLATRIGDDGNLRIFDCWSTNSQEWLSESHRRLFMQRLAPFANHKSVSLTPDEVTYLNYFEQAQQLEASLENNEPQKAWNELVRLPDVLQRQGHYLKIRTRLGAVLGGDVLEQTIRYIELHARKEESRVYWLAVLYAAKQDFERTRQAAMSLAQLLGEDAHLTVCVGWTYRMEGDDATARQYFEDAIAVEPDLPFPYWQLIDMALKERDHAETRRLLEMLVERANFELADLTQLPEYAAFVRSPEYKAWQEAREN